MCGVFVSDLAYLCCGCECGVLRMCLRVFALYALRGVMRACSFCACVVLCVGV
jgi:hypothetical protein